MEACNKSSYHSQISKFTKDIKKESDDGYSSYLSVSLKPKTISRGDA